MYDLSEIKEEIKEVKKMLKSLKPPLYDANYLTREEAAKMLRVHPNTISRKVKQKLLECSRPSGGRKIYFQKRVLEKYLSKQNQ